MKIRVSKHAEMRMRERLGLNKKSVERIALRAYENGVPHGRTKGNLKKWIDSVYFRKDNGVNKIVLYGEMAFLFENNVLVTVFQIPNSLKRDMDCMIKRLE